LSTTPASEELARAKAAARKRVTKPSRAAAGAKARARRRAGVAAPEAASQAPAPSAGPRRAIFIDVENTSSEVELMRVMEELEVDLRSGGTVVTAVGNWRVVGQHLGRRLAERGAHLVHSAPAIRVPDWSDLWIAVSAGMWLGRATPGDRLDIVSDDRAFDAVGDAAARLGVSFRRITCRTHGAAAQRTTSEEVPGGRRRRRRRRDNGSAVSSAAEPTEIAGGYGAVPAADAASGDGFEPHAASQEQIRAVIARLTALDPSRGVNLDVLTVALKAEGFQRPPGSPRLVTRLRRMRDLEVLRNGRVRLLTAGDAASPAGEQAAEPDSRRHADAAATGAEGSTRTPGKRRARRRGGRRGGARRRTDARAP
jgi:hypothetical protein